jgi:hypothetical protein
MHVCSCVAWQKTSYISVLLLGSDSTENSFRSVVAFVRVYRAVAWQLVDQIRYSIFQGFGNMENKPSDFLARRRAKAMVMQPYDTSF